MLLTGLRRFLGRAGALAPGRPGGVPAVRVTALAAAIAVVLGAGLVYAATGQPAAPATRDAGHARTASGAAVSAAALRVLSVSPAGGASGVDGAAPVRVVFSVPVAPDSPLPGLAPAVPGHWQRTGPATVTFTPATAFPPLTSVRVTVPAGRDGVRSRPAGCWPSR
ncbi:MAG: Ig-like domain-containing protein [Actinomycetota bacterium]|nr:Ig-like domain-containing protein [Actinomycetota bacterium]